MLYFTIIIYELQLRCQSQLIKYVNKNKIKRSELGSRSITPTHVSQLLNSKPIFDIYHVHASIWYSSWFHTQLHC